MGRHLFGLWAKIYASWAYINIGSGPNFRWALGLNLYGHGLKSIRAIVRNLYDSWDKGGTIVLGDGQPVHMV